jgi:hypothetical protein
MAGQTSGYSGKQQLVAVGHTAGQSMSTLATASHIGFLATSTDKSMPMKLPLAVSLRVLMRPASSATRLSSNSSDAQRAISTHSNMCSCGHHITSLIRLTNSAFLFFFISFSTNTFVHQGWSHRVFDQL